MGTSSKENTSVVLDMALASTIIMKQEASLQVSLGSLSIIVIVIVFSDSFSYLCLHVNQLRIL